MSYPLRRLMGLTLSASLIFSPTVSAYNNSALWFEHTDIQMPTTTKVGQLSNDLRFVALPTTRGSDEVSLRVLVHANDGISASALESAQSVAEQTEWQLSTNLGQILFSMDLDHADNEKIEQSLNTIKSRITEQSVYNPHNTTVIVTGGIETRATVKAIQRQFSDWKTQPGVQTTNTSSIQLNAFLSPTIEGDSSFSVRSVKPLQDGQDSKLHRKEVLLATLANKLLEHRIQHALEEQHSLAKVQVNSEILFNQQMLSQLQISDVSVDEKKTTEQIVQSEIQRALSSGFTSAEYELVVSKLRKQLESQTRRNSHNYTAEQADRLVQAIHTGTVYTQPSFDLDLLNFHVAHLNELDVSKEFESTWSTSGRVF